MRTCIGCREQRPKRELVRIVRTPAGTVEVDTTGKQAGRGTYLCRSAECWELGIRRQRLDHALHTTISPKEREGLLRYRETLSPPEE